ncbi:SoxR reducing system RseC family protein [Salipiger pentaromativorans]|uniref:SoxR reducing system RseC family protein n=1 Tax=Salipiger pentaromativorans TaxID=2943193 RepID=UPI002157250B
MAEARDDPEGAAPRALRQRLRVVAVEGGRMRLEGQRISACAQCAARTGCGAGALADLSGPAPLRLSLPHDGAAAPGDEVVVAMPAGAFLGAASLAYLLPPAALAATAALASAAGAPDVLAAALCLPAFVLSLLPLRRADRRGRLLSALSVAEIHPAEDGRA